MALIIPKFGLFIALIGALGSALLGFILPAASYLKVVLQFLHKVFPEASLLSRIKSLAIIGFGVLGAIVGTIMATVELIEAF